MTTAPRLTILGGGHEIGANCYLLEWGDHTYLLDAGRHPGIRGDVRVRWRDYLSLPDLERLRKPPAAILISHAHQDHIGSLPLVSRLFPDTPVICTRASASLIPLMLADASRVQNLLEPKRKGYHPEFYWETFYDKQDLKEIELNLARNAVAAMEPLELPGGLRATFWPTSHVLGSCGILLEKDGYRLFYSGDFSLSKQEIHSTTRLPELDTVDTLIMESTYGDRSEELDRPGAHQRLGEFVGALVSQGQSVLIPSFALGRTQDLLAGLARLKAEGTLPADLPIHVFGLAREVTRIYARHMDELDPELTELDLLAQMAPERDDNGQHLVIPPEVVAPNGPPLSAQEWERSLFNRIEGLLERRPCVILASSGMMNPGSIAWQVARVIAEGERHGIVFVGYAPPGSPAGNLLAAVPGDTVRMGQVRHGKSFRKVELVLANRNIGRISYSAHASRGELLRTVETLSPKNVILVHGDAKARESLEDALEHRFPVILPRRRGTLQLNNDGPDRVMDLSLIPAAVLIHGMSLVRNASARMLMSQDPQEWLQTWLERENALQACRETAIVELASPARSGWLYLLGNAGNEALLVRRLLGQWFRRQGWTVIEQSLPLSGNEQECAEAVADILAAHSPESQVLACADAASLQHRFCQTANLLDRTLNLLDEENRLSRFGGMPMTGSPKIFLAHTALIETLLYPQLDQDPHQSFLKLPKVLRSCFEYDEDMKRYTWSDFGRLYRQRWLEKADAAVLARG